MVIPPQYPPSKECVIMIPGFYPMTTVYVLQPSYRQNKTHLNLATLKNYPDMFKPVVTTKLRVEIGTVIKTVSGKVEVVQVDDGLAVGHFVES